MCISTSHWRFIPFCTDSNKTHTLTLKRKGFLWRLRYVVGRAPNKKQRLCSTILCWILTHNGPANGHISIKSPTRTYRIDHVASEDCPRARHNRRRRQRAPPRAPRTRARSNGTPRLRPPCCRGVPRPPGGRARCPHQPRPSAGGARAAATRACVPATSHHAHHPWSCHHLDTFLHFYLGSLTGTPY